MKEGLLAGTLSLSSRNEQKKARLHVARWVGFESGTARHCLVNESGELVAHTAAPPYADGLRHLADRLRGHRVRAVIESMTGARFVHDALEEFGWEVLVADAQKDKGLAPLACKPPTSRCSSCRRTERYVEADAALERILGRLDV
jgi:hypothetical protein